MSAYDELVEEIFRRARSVPSDIDSARFDRAAAAIRALEGERDSWKTARGESEEVIRQIVAAAGERPADRDIIDRIVHIIDPMSCEMRDFFPLVYAKARGKAETIRAMIQAQTDGAKALQDGRDG